MKTIHIFLIFVLVAAIQLSIPAQMILNQETILKTGTPYKFKTQPVDPSDPFKGKNINLNYEIDSFNTTDSLWERNEPIFVYLITDSLGFAKIDTVSRNILADNNNDYVKAKAQWYRNYSNDLTIQFPFNRYYMDETKAYDAEVTVRSRQQDSLPNNTFALVYVENGEAVLNDVLIDEISIKDYVKKRGLN